MLMDYVQRGGPVMYPLLVCSIVALAVITERLLFWMRRKVNLTAAMTYLQLIREGKDEAAFDLSHSTEDPLLRVLRRGMAERELAPSLAMEMHAKDELSDMRRYLSVLDTTITLAPLLGIYGTITGIINAFGFLSSTGVPDPRLVAAGIAEALITTAGGLTIALSAIPFYNHFIRRQERVTEEIEHHATKLELILEQRRRAERPSRLSEPVG